MSIHLLETVRKLRRQFGRLGREGLSERAHKLVMDYVTKHPTGHWREAIILAGRLRAISLAARADAYWGEKTDKGYHEEVFDLAKFQPSEEVKA